MEKVVIFGISSAAILSHFAFTHDSPYEVVAFTVDRNYMKEQEFCGLPVVSFEDIESVYPPSNYKMFIAVYSSRVNKTRAEKYYQAKEKGYDLITYISSKAIVSPDLVIGDNCFISEGVICRPFLKIENDVIVMPGASLGHNSVIKDHCLLSARVVLLGGVTVEPYCSIGANATILESVTVAKACVIGAGSVIHEDTQEKGVYRVNPPTLLPLSSDRMANILFKGRTHA
jgi:sugar O-acyltransferase (sialic acid O-acetyltransferase NeuD family)